MEIIVLALIAGFLIWRLRSVLGRRTGHERPPQAPFGGSRPVDMQGTSSNDANANSNVIHMPDKGREHPLVTEAAHKIADLAKDNPELRDGLEAIQGADRFFDPEHFLTGARSAYEMIINAFAAGDRSALRPLLAESVYTSFDGAIEDREQKQQRQETEFIGIETAEIIKADLKSRIAEVTVRFISELVSVSKNDQDEIVEGDPTQIRKVTDIWTFSRDVTGSDPNWKLAGTAAANG